MPNDERSPAGVVTEIDIDEFGDLITSETTVLDVREPDEYLAGHVPGAESVPLGGVANHLDRFASDGPTYLICLSGGRSMRAAQLAASQGYEVVNVIGGTRAWIESGRDVVAGDTPT